MIHGPGCPVCVLPVGRLDLAIELARREEVTLCTYGDMLRVPGRHGSLERARSRGADVRVVYSTLDAVRLAQDQPDRQVVFGAVGFETTAPATAIAVLEAQRRGLDNFSILASHKLVVPAMLGLLADKHQPANLDGFLCPGHVSVIIGSDAYAPIVDRHAIPCVIGGFEEFLMADALVALARQVRDGQAELVNQYPEAVTPEGNVVAMHRLETVFRPADVRWRGLGVIPGSGLVLRPAFAKYDAELRFNIPKPEDREPKGCLCGQVIAGRVTPDQCTLFGTTCTPIRPIGPCMVSSEGTCQAWFKYARGGGASVLSAGASASARKTAAARNGGAT